MSKLFFCFAEIGKKPGTTIYWARESEDEEAIHMVRRVTYLGKEVMQEPVDIPKHEC